MMVVGVLPAYPIRRCEKRQIHRNAISHSLAEIVSRVPAHSLLIGTVPSSLSLKQ